MLSNPPLPALAANSGHGRIGDGLGRRQSRQLGRQLARLAGDELEPAGRDIGGGDAPFVAGARHRRQPVGRRRRQQRFLGQRPRRHQPDDRPLDQRLRPARLARFRRAFDLLGDGDPVAAFDQPGEIGFRRQWTGTPHIGIGSPPSAAALGQRDVEAGCGRLGIVEEQFEEIAHPVEQQGVAGLGLQPMVLRHHRGQSVGAGHRPQVVTAKRAPSEGDSGMKLPLRAPRQERGAAWKATSNSRTRKRSISTPAAGPGKIEIVATKPMATQRDLSLAYSPGVAVPVEAIAADPGPRL